MRAQVLDIPNADNSTPKKVTDKGCLPRSKTIDCNDQWQLLFWRFLSSKHCTYPSFKFRIHSTRAGESYVQRYGILSRNCGQLFAVHWLHTKHQLSDDEVVLHDDLQGFPRTSTDYYACSHVNLNKTRLRQQRNNCGSTVPSFTDKINHLQKCILVYGPLGCNECICIILYGKVSAILQVLAEEAVTSACRAIYGRDFLGGRSSLAPMSASFSSVNTWRFCFYFLIQYRTRSFDFFFPK